MDALTAVWRAAAIVPYNNRRTMITREAQAIANDMLDLGHFVFEGVSWDFYEFILDRRERARLHARITYDEGRMELFTGAGVKGELVEPLSRMLRGFSFARELGSAGLPKRLREWQAGEEDFLYLVAVDECSSDGERTIELTITRREITDGPPGSERGVIGPAQLEMKGRVIGTRRGRAWVPAPDSVLFPEVDLKSHFNFVLSKQKDGLRH
jgi:hypothetical protein